MSVKIAHEGNKSITLEDLIKKETIHGTDIEPIYWFNQKENQRLAVSIAGASGSGKSTLASKIVDYLSQKLKYQVFIFSVNSGEDVLIKKRPVKYEVMKPKVIRGKLQLMQELTGEIVPIMEKKVVEEPLYPIRIDYMAPSIWEEPLEYWRKSIVIFDDIEDLGDKDATKRVKQLQSLFYTAGRKLDIHMVNTLHNMRDSNPLTKLENTFWVFAHRGSPKFKLVGILIDLLGMKRRDAEKVVSELGDSRHVAIHTTYPNYIIGSKLIKLL